MVAVEVRVSTRVFSRPCDGRRWSDDTVSWGFSLSVNTDAVWRVGCTGERKEKLITWKRPIRNLVVLESTYWCTFCR